jgi:hypothetical protein
MFLLKPPERDLADFLAPLPLETCVEKLNGRHGKFFGYHTGVYIHEMEMDRYTFRIRVESMERGSLNVTVVGSLMRQDDTTTHIMISREEQYETEIRWIIGIAAALGLLLSVLTQNPLPLPLALVVGVGMVYHEHNKYHQVVEMIQETLDVHPPRKKDKSG